MSKKRFIQTVIARSLPSPDKRQAALDYAESLWTWLTQKGYGDDKPSQPRQGQDYYRALSPEQSCWFDKFWSVYNHKQGRNEAAMRWGQMMDCSGDQPVAPTDKFYQRVIEAAGKEAMKALPQGQVRKMAQGWLFEQRYNDYVPTQKPKQNRSLVLNQLNNDLAALKALHDSSPNYALLVQIQQKEQAIKAAGGTV
jgi:hypothetical protein